VENGCVKCTENSTERSTNRLLEQDLNTAEKVKKYFLY